MNAEQKYWLRIWTLAAVSILGLFVSYLTYCTVKNSLVKDMVAKGTDPIAAKCAVTDWGTTSASSICSRLSNAN
jgi:hypothetical protein